MTTQAQTTSLISVAPASNEPILDHIQLGQTPSRILCTSKNEMLLKPGLAYIPMVVLSAITQNTRWCHQMFLTALGYGIEAYCECDVDKRQMSAQQLLDMLLEAVLDERDDLTGKRVSYSWRLGFLMGQVAGILHPDLVDADPTLTYLESLSEKCARLYPQEK